MGVLKVRMLDDATNCFMPIHGKLQYNGQGLRENAIKTDSAERKKTRADKVATSQGKPFIQLEGHLEGHLEGLGGFIYEIQKRQMILI